MAMGHCVKRESETARLRPLRGVQMSRAHVAWLVVLAALLVFDGERPAPPSGEAAVTLLGAASRRPGSARTRWLRSCAI